MTTSRDTSLVVMPQLGESIVEATLAKWRVAPGERVERGQVLAEVETDKATNEVPSPRAGVVGTLLLAEGVTAKVGTPILRYQGDDAAVEPPPASARPAPAQPAAVQARLPSQHLADRPIGPDGEPRRASPVARRIAREKGIDLANVEGSGRGGRITREDVLSAGAAPAAPVPAPEPVLTQRPSTRAYRVPSYEPMPGDQVVPFTRRRAYIAEHMRYSLDAAAHVAAVVEIDAGGVLAAQAAEKAEAEKSGIKLSFTAYAVAAVAKALREHPVLNATVHGDALVLRGQRNIGVAVDTKEGLVVPVVKRADELGLLGIARAIQDLAKRAREGALTPDDLSGGTFSISNPGKDGNLFGISIIRQPEVAILRLGEIAKRAVVRTFAGQDAIVIRPVMYAALSYDHRVIDGAAGNAFLHRVKALLEAQPAPAISSG